MSRTSEATRQEELVVTVPLEAWRKYLERRHAKASEMEYRAQEAGDDEAENEWMDRRLELAAEVRNELKPPEEERAQEVEFDLNCLLDLVSHDDLPLLVREESA